MTIFHYPALKGKVLDDYDGEEMNETIKDLLIVKVFFLR